MGHERQQCWGIMGGAFDPVHNGHIELARSARNAFNLDQVLFVVSYNPPHRIEKPSVSFNRRYEMVDLAVKDIEEFTVSDVEKDMSGPGYTIDMVRALDKRHPGIDWFLILGADNLEIFDSWYKPDELLDMVKVVVGNRPGYNSETGKKEWINKIKFFELPPTDISSTMVRSRLKSGNDVDDLIPQRAAEYIRINGLYE
jgi:nicotinate-nucleotide adenylyltransferase